MKTEGANLNGVSVGSLWNGLDVVPNALAGKLVGVPTKVGLDSLIRRAQQDAKSKRGKSLNESRDQAVTEGCGAYPNSSCEDELYEGSESIMSARLQQLTTEHLASIAQTQVTMARGALIHQTTVTLAGYGRGECW